MNALAWLLPIYGLSQLSTNRTYKDVLGVAGVSRQQISGKEINIFSTSIAWLYFHPKEVLYVGILRSTKDALCSIKMPNFLFKA